MEKDIAGILGQKLAASKGVIMRVGPVLLEPGSGEVRLERNLDGEKVNRVCRNNVARTPATTDDGLLDRLGIRPLQEGVDYLPFP